MRKSDFLNTLFVGIDVSSKSNTVCAIDFTCNHILDITVANNNPGAVQLVEALSNILTDNSFVHLIIALVLQL